MKQFDLTDLPKISRAELAFQKQKLQFQFDLSTLGDVVAEALTGLEPNIFESFALRFKSGRLEKRERLVHALPDTSLHLYGTLEPLGCGSLLCIPKATAKDLVYSLLGSAAPHSPSSGALSAIEEGIFVFILTTAIDALKSRLDLLGLNIRLAPLANVGLAADHLDPMSSFIDLIFEMSIKETTCEIHLVLENNATLLSLLGTQRTDALSDTDNGFKRASHAQVPISIVLGHASIFASELDALQVDNIVVLDKALVSLTSGELAGSVDCQIGDLDSATIKAELFKSEDSRYALRIF